VRQITTEIQLSNPQLTTSNKPFKRKRKMKKNVSKFVNKKFFSVKSDLQVERVACAALMAASLTTAMAQGNGLAGINEATSMVTSYFEPGTKLIYAIGAVVGLIGGVKVYGKFSSGDPDTSKTAASWFGACIFLIVAATILRSFFL